MKRPGKKLAWGALACLICVGALLLVWSFQRSKTFMNPLKEGESGPYATLVSRPNPDHYTLQYIPSLAALLLNVEGKVERELTQKEVEILRDKANVIAVKPEMARAVEENRRGYKDLDPTNVWKEYQWLRLQTKKES